MIAQWETECISLFVLSMARVTIAQWETECSSLFVLSVARVMIAQWDTECSSLFVPLLTMAEYFKGFFPG